MLHYEHIGEFRPLTPQFIAFLRARLRGASLDQPDLSQVKRPDYNCLNGLLAVEIKSLEGDPRVRLDPFFKKLCERSEWPDLFGSVATSALISKFPDADAITREWYGRFGRPIQTHVSKANKQFAAYDKLVPRNRRLRLLVLINENHAAYEPMPVCVVLQRLLTGQKQTEYTSIDAALYLNNRHLHQSTERISLPIMIVDSSGIDQHPWKSELIDFAISKWADWTGSELYSADYTGGVFHLIEEVRASMPRFELWELEYKRMPYMADWSLERLKAVLAEVMCLVGLKFEIGSPYKPKDSDVAHMSMKMSHIGIEVGRRVIPMSRLLPSSKELALAAKRLALSEEVILWISRS